MITYLIECDHCSGPDATPYVLDLGDAAVPPRRVDLCTGCRFALGLDALTALLDEYGATPEQSAVTTKTKSSSKSASKYVPGEWRCPDCSLTYTTRVSVIGHMSAVHGVDEIAASKLVPPTGSAAVCETCGYVAQIGTGIAVHRRKHVRAASSARAG